MKKFGVILRSLSWALVAAVIVAVLSAGMVLWGLFRGNHGEKPLPTVAGPETAGLVSRMDGFLVLPGRGGDKTKSELGVLSLPDLKETVLRPVTAGRTQIVNSLSGPDEDGRIVYVHGALNTTFLKVIGIDGQGDEIISQHPGGFAKPGIEDLSLSPRGGQVAFLRDSGRGVKFPGSYIGVGALEIWDLEKKRRQETPGIDALMSWSLSPFLSWFPDGRRLAYVATVPRKDLSSIPADFDQSFKAWSDVPAIYILNLYTGALEFVHAGWGPVVSRDGKFVLARDAGGHYRKIDLAARKSEAVEWPGEWHGGAIALLEEGLLLYWGLPTTGAPVRRSPYGSFKAGTQLITIKAAELATGKFQTLVPHIDPRWEASYGRLKDGARRR